MRIRFPDPADAREAKDRAKLEKSIDAWWKAFASHTSDIDAVFSRKKSWDLPKFMQKNLGAVDTRLMWEFGPALSGKGHRLVITPESEHALVPLVALVLSRAPKIRGWEFHPYRVAESTEGLGMLVRGRLDREVPEMRAIVTPGEHGTVALEYLIDGCRGDNDDAAYALAFVTTQTLCGEKILEQDVSSIGVGPLKKKRKAVPLERIRREVDRVLAANKKALPNKTCRQRAAKAQWSLLKNEPKERKDYPGQSDIFVAVTMWAELFMATHSEMPFFSHHFSRHGETFAYLKIDGAKGLAGSTYEDRDDVENAIDEVLGPKLGAVIGGGTGLRYSYVELALENADRALPRIREALRKGKIPERTWILFHDATLEHEWLGIHPKTPRPPT